MTGALLLCALLAGCMPLAYSGAEGGTATAQESDTAVPLTPVQSVDVQRQSYTLYFRYGGEEYLAGEQRLLPVSEDKPIERVLLQEMIKNGPSAGSLYLEPVINPKTSVISVSSNREYLYITLSREFLDPISGEAPGNWEEDPAWREAVYTERRLAVMAIVNTMTELGEYSRIQILIDTDGTKQGVRPTREMLGFAGDDKTQNAQLMGPLTRDPSMVLTPGNTLSLIMKRFSEKDWTGVDEIIARDDQYGNVKPSTDEVVGMLAVLDISLTGYAITGEMVSNDGQSAVVTVSYEFQLKNGSTYTHDDVSMRMEREDSVWKLVYPSISQLLNNAKS